MSKKITSILFTMFLAPSLAYANYAEFIWDHYSSPPSLKSQLSDYLMLKIDHKFPVSKKPFYFESRFQVEYNFDQSQIFHFNIPELYLSSNYYLKTPLFSIESLEIQLGRKIKTWSLGDKYWGLGLWNPLVRWNPLHPEISGLIGSFLTLKSSRWESDFFVGALYLPNLQPNFDTTKDGRSYTTSRWGSILPDKVSQYNIGIYYSPISPYIFDILFQESFAISFKTWVQAPDTFYWMKWSLANKPTNHLYFILNQKNRVKVSKEKKDSSLFVDQSIGILQARQRILSTEWGLEYKDLSLNFSLENVKIRAEKSAERHGWAFTNARENFTYFSLLLQYHYLNKHFFQMGFIQSFFRNYSLDKGSSNPPVLLVNNRVLEGLSFSLQSEWKNHKSLPFLIDLKYQYSFLDEGAWLFTKLSYYIHPKAYSSLTLNILGFGNKSNKHQAQSFLGSFKHNDYFSWSIAYDF